MFRSQERHCCPDVLGPLRLSETALAPLVMEAYLQGIGVRKRVNPSSSAPRGHPEIHGRAGGFSLT